ncbi:cholinesterase 1-like [Anneissia japonica]|uniref:cholinesterase 1-like n=1 Tax=Anneissia japonica TaxID=1529436 RepID=UPI0014259E98|nr:cholinesterase 1-like [Anneissia japonica]
MSLLLCLLVGLGLITGTVAEVPGGGPIVSTTYGDVMGEKLYFSEDQYLNYSGYFNYFKGIPYAEPPIGNLRFRPPETVAPWPDVYNATYFRSDCPQIQSPSSSEDCLHLNVLVPVKNLTDAPVMVWIHGGQYSFGSGSQDFYWGVPLLAASGGDVILVTLNYRLGVFGFQTTGDDVSPGNYGLMDQSMALQWVRENIEAFGGDPEKVTIFGVSAGAGSVSAHLLASTKCDLFQRAILQSGSMFDSSAMIELNITRAVKANKYVASMVGCETESSTNMVECMRNASMHDILKATLEVEKHLSGPRRTVVFYPVVDKKFIPDYPEELIKSGEFKKVDLILGVNRDEGTFWLNEIFDSDDLLADEPPHINETYFGHLLQKIFPNDNKLYIDSLKQEYTDWENADDPEYNYIQEWAKLSTDELFQCPTDVTARALADAGKYVYRYVNTQIPSRAALSPELCYPEWHGVSHVDDVPFVFGWHFNTEFKTPFTQTKEEVIMSLKVMRYWTNFAKTGNPNMAEINVTTVAEPWPLFTVPGLEYKELSPEMENDRAVAARECSFWANYLPKVSLFTDDLPDLEEDWRNSYYDWKYVALEEWQTVFNEYKELTEPCT